MSKARSRQKHVPQRTCVVCRRTLPKRELTRIVRTPDQGVRIDPTGKLAGRGAYLCGDSECWGKAARGDVLNEALRASLTDQEREMIAARGVEMSRPAR